MRYNIFAIILLAAAIFIGGCLPQPGKPNRREIPQLTNKEQAQKNWFRPHSIYCEVIIKIRRIAVIDDNRKMDMLIKSYNIDENGTYRVWAEVFERSRGCPVEPGYRCFVINSPQEIFKQPVENISGFWSMKFIWNVNSPNKPEFQNCEAERLQVEITHKPTEDEKEAKRQQELITLMREQIEGTITQNDPERLLVLSDQFMKTIDRQEKPVSSLLQFRYGELLFRKAEALQKTGHGTEAFQVFTECSRRGMAPWATLSAKKLSPDIE